MKREQLKAVYLDWLNNFLTIECFAEYYGLWKTEAECLIELARNVYNNPHPEA